MGKRVLLVVVIPALMFLAGPAGAGSNGIGPSISSLDHVTGPTAGAQCDVIRGTGFQAGATVLFGTNSATVSAVTSTAISVVTPGALVTGAVDIRVTNPDTSFAVDPNGYTYTSATVAPLAKAGSSPGAVGVAGPQLNLFDLTPSGTIEHTVWECGLWDDPEDLGGTLISGPAASSSDAGTLQVFAQGTANDLGENARDANDVWGGWTSLGGVLASKPGAISWGPGRIDVFVVGTDTHVWHKWLTGGVWSGWQGLGGVVATGTGPGVASMGSGLLEVFVRGTDKAVWEKTWNGSKWSSWTSLGGQIVGSPGGASAAANQLQVFARGTNNALWYRTYTTPTWGPWKSLGGTLTTGPAATVAPDVANITAVYVQWLDGSIYEIRSTNGVWGSWAAVP